ncbi:putative U4/U6.U5 tri-snRNP-associated protein 1 [Blattamonas nauphoetae]|uniref:U4/U6.U5 tri-snRNP-associated protein 1 n=1 Tax=Blattamonas nauphoetae TaxID=2049346 RepID=A0ABQ9YLQ3_9EUKA|nr:putative U4/U6.U5 tri-snRNP-associated protein 1 [Blattamonas nauphoetae]
MSDEPEPREFRSELSIDEVNALRIKMGKKPLRPQNSTQIPVSDQSDISVQQAQHEKENTRKQLEEGKAKMIQGQEQRKLEEEGLTFVKSLKEVPFSFDDFLKSYNPKPDTKSAGQQSHRLHSSSIDHNSSLRSIPDQPNYTSSSITGLKVRHDMNEIDVGKDIILTLKDSSVLSDGEDELENDFIVQKGKDSYRQQMKKQQSKQNPYLMDDEQEDSDEILSKYDADEKRKQREEMKGFRLGSEVRAPAAEEKEEKEGEDLDVIYGFQRDYLTDEEIAALKKKRQKKGKKTRMKGSFDISTIINKDEDAQLPTAMLKDESVPSSAELVSEEAAPSGASSFESHVQKRYNASKQRYESVLDKARQQGLSQDNKIAETEMGIFDLFDFGENQTQQRMEGTPFDDEEKIESVSWLGKMKGKSKADRMKHLSELKEEQPDDPLSSENTATTEEGFIVSGVSQIVRTIDSVLERQEQQHALEEMETFVVKEETPVLHSNVAPHNSHTPPHTSGWTDLNDPDNDVRVGTKRQLSEIEEYQPFHGQKEMKFEEDKLSDRPSSDTPSKDQSEIGMFNVPDVSRSVAGALKYLAFTNEIPKADSVADYFSSPSVVGKKQKGKYMSADIILASRPAITSSADTQRRKPLDLKTATPEEIGGDIDLTKRNEKGEELSTTAYWKAYSHQFHGNAPKSSKKTKQTREQEKKLLAARAMANDDGVLPSMSLLNKVQHNSKEFGIDFDPTAVLEESRRLSVKARKNK